MKSTKQQNCWEVTGCGREPGGIRAAKFGVCPASTDTTSNGANGGKNGGRMCWAIAGTFCGGKVRGSLAEKHLTCLNCAFYKQVAAEQGAGFTLLKPGQSYKNADAHGEKHKK